MITNDFEIELDRLEQLAAETADEFYQTCRRLGFFVPLWPKTRRRGNTFQIEWVVPSKARGSQWKQRYLSKGYTAKYPTSVLTQAIKSAKHLSESQKTEAIRHALAFEERFAEIRSAALLLTEAKRARQRYQKQLALLLEHRKKPWEHT